MDFFSIYITVFFFVFLVFPSIFFLVKLVLWCRDEHCKGPASNNNNDVRRTTIYTITANRQATDRNDVYPDYFWDLSPQTSEANNVAGKDDKDLPSYDEVMRIERERQETVELSQTTTNSTTPAVVAAPPVLAAPGVSVGQESPPNQVPASRDPSIV